MKYNTETVNGLKEILDAEVAHAYGNGRERLCDHECSRYTQRLMQMAAAVKGADRTRADFYYDALCFMATLNMVGIYSAMDARDFDTIFSEASEMVSDAVHAWPYMGLEVSEAH